MSPLYPHSLNHVPPGAQQLYFPEFSSMPHDEHAVVLIVPVTGSVGNREGE